MSEFEEKDEKQEGCCGNHSCCGHQEKGEKQDVKFPKDVPLPEPSLLTLATSIATQAMVSMGIFPNPATGKSEFLLHQAKHLIDTVDLIFQKTEGNRTEEETKTIENMVHELRMLFVAAQSEKAKRDAAK